MDLLNLEYISERHKNIIVNITSNIVQIDFLNLEYLVLKIYLYKNCHFQSAQLMNQTMEQLTSSAATNQQNIAAIEQATHSSQSPPTIPMQTTTTPDRSQHAVVPMQQQTTEPQVTSTVDQNQVGKKQTNDNLMTQGLMTDHELLNYINSEYLVDQAPMFMGGMSNM